MRHQLPAVCKVMLRNRKADVIVIGGTLCYNEVIKSKGDFVMKLPDKIIALR